MQQLISIETVPISIKYVGKPFIPGYGDTAPASKSVEEGEGKITASLNKEDFFVQGYAGGIHNLTYTASAQKAEGDGLQLNIDVSGESNEFSFYRFSRDMQNMISRIIESHRSNGDAINLPDFKIEILEKPEVIIKYVGGPIYIPRSADPDYDADDDTNPPD